MNKFYFAFILFLTLIGNVNAQQVILFPYSEAIAVLALDKEEHGITLKPSNHKDAKDYTKLNKTGSYNIFVICKEPSFVHISLWRNGALYNRVKLYGQKVASICTILPNDTVEINTLVDQEQKEKKSSTIQSKLD